MVENLVENPSLLKPSSKSSPQVLVLNGGSSSGKSSLAKALQEILSEYWLRLGVDTLIDAAPPKLLSNGGGGLKLATDGTVTAGEDFAKIEAQWMQGVAAIVKAGGYVIIEDNFISGVIAQQRWRSALGDIPTRWVGVMCPPNIATEREKNRGDRTTGMAAKQADAVHQGIEYDMTVDTSLDNANNLAKHVCKQLGLNQA